MRLGLVGYGFVGHAIHAFFRDCHQVAIYDPFIKGYDSGDIRAIINASDLVFIAVPTPFDTAHGQCDLSAISDTFSWLKAPACIKSTIPPGTTEELVKMRGTRIAFSPEYIGESFDHPWPTIAHCGFVIVGGDPSMAQLIFDAYRLVAGETLSYHHTTSTTAELCKYMENAFLATKISFVNQFYDIADRLGVNFSELSHLWRLDNRVGYSHSDVIPERGFGGKCLPKDLAAIIATMRPFCSVEFLEFVADYNRRLRLGVSRQGETMTR